MASLCGRFQRAVGNLACRSASTRFVAATAVPASAAGARAAIPPTPPSTGSATAASPGSMRPVETRATAPSLLAKAMKSPTLANLMALRKRDPRRPVRPQSGFMRFGTDMREQAKLQKLKAPTMKDIGAKWKALPEASQKKFTDLAQKDVANYEKAFKEYVDSGKKEEWIRDPAKPKRPMTGYMRFCAEYRSRNPGNKKPTEVIKASSKLWKEMDAKAKDHYNQLHLRDKALYEKNFKAYKESDKESAWREKVGITAIEKKVKEKLQAIKEKARAEKLKIKEAAEAKKTKVSAAKMKKTGATAAVKAKKVTTATTVKTATQKKSGTVLAAGTKDTATGVVKAKTVTQSTVRV